MLLKENLGKFRINLLLILRLSVLTSIVCIVYFMYGKYSNIENRVKEKDNLIINLNKKIDSLNILNIEYKEFQDYKIRRRAEKISGLIIPSKFKIKHINKVFSECKKYNIPPRVAFRLIYKESSFNKNSVSYAGAKGFMQIMPGTYRGYARKLNIKGESATENLEVGIFYLKTLYTYFNRKKDLTTKEKWKLTVLSYNYGISKVGRNRSRFLGPEFKNYSYVNFIIS